MYPYIHNKNEITQAYHSERSRHTVQMIENHAGYCVYSKTKEKKRFTNAFQRRA